MTLMNLDKLRELAALRKKCTTQDEWFCGTPTNEQHKKEGLCHVDDGQVHGMFPITCEWHEGHFIAAAGNMDFEEILKYIENLHSNIRHLQPS